MKDKLRKGIAMIELIFALVVIGITLMSAPLIISQSVQSNFTSFQQESIAIAAAHANTLLSYAWDEQNTDDGLGGTGSNVLVVKNGDIDLERNATLRGTTTPKIPNQQRLRRFSPAGAAASLLLRDENVSGLKNDVDDFNGNISSLHLYGNDQQTQIGEYIDQSISIGTVVTYGSAEADYNDGDGNNEFSFDNPFATGLDIAANQSSNVKRITTTLTSTSTNADLSAKRIVLQAFMCNIGAANPLQTSGN